MAYANVDAAHTWRIPAHGVRASQVVQITIPATATYVAMDFSDVLASPVAIASAGSPTEVASKTITLAGEALDPTNRIVSLTVAGMALGDYEINVPVVLSEAAGDLTGRGILRVV